MRGTALGKKMSGLQQKNVEMKTKKNGKHLEVEVVALALRHSLFR